MKKYWSLISFMLVGIICLAMPVYSVMMMRLLAGVCFQFKVNFKGGNWQISLALFFLFHCLPSATGKKNQFLCLTCSVVKPGLDEYGWSLAYDQVGPGISFAEQCGC